jgi:hypothetical protein
MGAAKTMADISTKWTAVSTKVKVVTLFSQVKL